MTWEYGSDAGATTAFCPRIVHTPYWFSRDWSDRKRVWSDLMPSACHYGVTLVCAVHLGLSDRVTGVTAWTYPGCHSSQGRSCPRPQGCWAGGSPGRAAANLLWATQAEQSTSLWALCGPHSTGSCSVSGHCRERCSANDRRTHGP